MSSNDALTVSLTPEPSAFVHAEVPSGRRLTAGEVVRAGPRLPTRLAPTSSIRDLRPLLRRGAGKPD